MLWFARLTLLLLWAPQTVTSADSSNQDLQMQLSSAREELETTRGVLSEVMQQRADAVQAACERRTGALRLLLAQYVQDLQEAQEARSAAVQLAADKVSRVVGQCA